MNWYTKSLIRGNSLQIFLTGGVKHKAYHSDRKYTEILRFQITQTNTRNKLMIFASNVINDDLHIDKIIKEQNIWTGKILNKNAIELKCWFTSCCLHVILFSSQIN